MKLICKNPIAPIKRTEDLCEFGLFQDRLNGFVNMLPDYSFRLFDYFFLCIHIALPGPALSHVWQRVKLSDPMSWGPSAI